ncbi:MAG: hypothetical protein EOM20_21680 [Spartobacteria bacterium]|nr:hypothetical protein [Spartobacteria bacterium]
MDELFLEGIRIENYRSFREPVVFDNLSKINILIGQNNSGKSNLLRFLSRHYLNMGPDSKIKFNDLEDAPQGTQNVGVEVGLK